MSASDVVITGVGVVSPLGVGREAFWTALDQGQSGVTDYPQLAAADLPFRHAGIIKGFDAKLYVQPRKTIKVMSSEIQAGYSASMLAMQDAGLEKGSVAPDRLGVVLGSEMLYGEVGEMIDVYRHCCPGGENGSGGDGTKFRFDQWGTHVFKDLYPLWMLKYLPNMAACHVSIAHDARGPNNSIVEGGVSSLLAIMEAATYIRRGHADVMIAGGSGSYLTFSCLPFHGWDHLSKWSGDPAKASRPFDARRSGVVPGEGAAALILERREHAQARGATILATIRGYASRLEPVRRGRPLEGTAIRNSIAAALSNANMKASDVGHVNAHGQGSLEHDRVEAQAIHDTLGNAPVTAPKSFFGDLNAGTGAVELAASVLGLAKKRIPRTLNYEEPDPACPINVIHGASLALENPLAIKLSQSTTGQATAVVLEAA